MSGKAKESGLHEKNSLKTKDPRTPVHFNGHQACVVHATYYPQSDDIRTLVIFPFNIHFNLVPEIAPFVCEIQSPEKLSLDYGLLVDAVPDTLSGWLQGMRLPYGKKIVAICWDSHRLRRGLYKLIDEDIDDIIHSWRDLLQYARFLNDLAWDRGEKIPFPKDHLGSALKRCLKVEVTLSDAANTAYLMVSLFKHFLKRAYHD